MTPDCPPGEGVLTKLVHPFEQTPLAIGIGQKAIEAGYRVLFRNALDLVEKLELAEMKGEIKKKIRQLGKADVLIIDELGFLPMSRQGRYSLFQLINSLYEYRSVILTTNKDFTAWGEFFHDDNVAVPIIDRIIRKCPAKYILPLSWRGSDDAGQSSERGVAAWVGGSAGGASGSGWWTVGRVAA